MAILRANAKLTLPKDFKDFEGAGLATIDVTFRRPDRPVLLQNLIWQEYDLYPWFPVMSAFIEYWVLHLDSPPLFARIFHPRMRGWAEIRVIGGTFTPQ